MPETEENKREQVEVILLMAVPMRLLAYPEDSSKFLQEGERLAKELGDGKSRAYLNNFIGLFYSFKGDPTHGRKYLEGAFAEGEKMQDIEIMAPVGVSLCVSYASEGEHRKIVTIAPKVITLLEKTHRESEFFGFLSNPYSQLQGQYGRGLAALGEFRAGEQLLEKALSFAQKSNHFFSIGIVENLYGDLFLFKGEGENAIKHTQSAIEYFEKSRAVVYLSLAWVRLGYGYYLLDEFNGALKFTEKGLKMQQDAGLSLYLSLIHSTLSMIHNDSGHWEEGKVQAEQGLKFAQTNHEKINEGLLWLQVGRAIGKIEKSQLDTGKEYIHKGMKILEELKIKASSSQGHLYLGELYAEAGQKEKALEHLEKAQGLFQKMGMNYWLGRTRKVLERLPM
jgi:tetratricopeptide (TPR) repeat protein